MTVRGSRESGVALAVVVWFIAGMSLLVAGVVLSARTDVRLAQVHMGRAEASTAGDGAITLLMADIRDGAFSLGGDTRLPQQQYQLGDVQIHVLAVPTEWLLDVNTASAPLLASVFEMSGALPKGNAQYLANAVVQWRQGSGRSGGTRLEAVEDLLSAPGVNRRTWDGVRDYIAVPVGGVGLSRPGARAMQRLRLLGQLAPEIRVRNRGQAPVDVPVGQTRATGYRVDALVKIGETFWLRRRWVSLSASAGALPWRVYRTEPARIVSRPGPAV